MEIKRYIDENQEYLMILPETAFEIDYLKSLHNKPIKAFLKCGVTSSELVGLKIELDKKGE